MKQQTNKEIPDLATELEDAIQLEFSNLSVSLMERIESGDDTDLQETTESLASKIGAFFGIDDEEEDDLSKALKDEIQGVLNAKLIEACNELAERFSRYVFEDAEAKSVEAMIGRLRAERHRV